MKLLFLLFSLLCLTNGSLVSNLKRIQTKESVTTWRSEFYNYCVVIEKANHLFSANESCENVKTFESKYNCSKQDEIELLKSHVASATPKKKVIEKKLPIDTKYAILSASNCKGKRIEMNKYVTHKYKDGKKQRVRLINGFLRTQNNNLKFYEAGEDVLSFSPTYAHKNSLQWAVDEFNKSQRMLKKSIELGAPNSNNIHPEPIILNEDGDLHIELSQLYVEKVVSDIFHQIIYICAKGKDRAYHFISDRSARDLTHEKNPLLKTVTRIWSGSMMHTLVRLAYYNASPDCSDEEQRPDAKKFDPNSDLVLINADTKPEEVQQHLEKYPREKFRPRNYKKPSLFLKNEDKYNFNERLKFKNFLLAIQRYAFRYEWYDPKNNCQHFATNMWNFLNHQKIDYINENYMKRLGLETEPFDIFFDFKLKDMDFWAITLRSKSGK